MNTLNSLSKKSGAKQFLCGARTQGLRPGLTCFAPPALRRKREPSSEESGGWSGAVDMMTGASTILSLMYTQVAGASERRSRSTL